MTSDPQTKIKFAIDITPAGWTNYQLEDMARAAVWVVRRFAATPDVKVVDCTLSATQLQAHLEVSGSVAMGTLNGIPAQLKSLAEIPLASCSCGCGVDLSVTECYRDSIEAVKEKRLNKDERDLAASGNSVEAIRRFRARTGMPLKDAADLVAKHRQALQAAFEAAGASLPAEGSGTPLGPLPTHPGGRKVQIVDDAEAMMRDLVRSGIIRKGVPEDHARDILRRLEQLEREKSQADRNRSMMIDPANPYRGRMLGRLGGDE